MGVSIGKLCMNPVQPAAYGGALLQPPAQQPGHGGERVAHPVDVLPAAPQQSRVTVGQGSDLQQQRVVEAVLHAAQEGHQVDERAVSVGLEKGGNEKMTNASVS